MIIVIENELQRELRHLMPEFFYNINPIEIPKQNASACILKKRPSGELILANDIFG